MKKTLYIFSLLTALLAMMTLSGCNSDGDETISLEYGNPKKMIVGKWKLGSIYRYVNGTPQQGLSYGKWQIGTVLVFFDDGTYTDSSDNGKGKHRWRLKGDSSESEPYYGGISLDNDDYDIGSFGKGHWVLIPRGDNSGGSGYDDGDDDNDNRWHLGWDKNDDNDDENDDNNGGKDPDQQPTTPEINTLIKKIIKKNSNGYNQTWEFAYDNNRRVTKMKTDYFTFSYTYQGDQINVSGYGSGITASLNNAGYIISAIAKQSNMKTTYTYDSNGFLKKAHNSYFDFEVQYKDGILKSVVQKDNFGTNNYTYEGSINKNNANLDLNCFIISPMFENGVVDNMLLFAPFDLFGKRSETLIMTEWTNQNIGVNHLWYERDNNDRIVKITYYIGMSASDTNNKTEIEISY